MTTNNLLSQIQSAVQAFCADGISHEPGRDLDRVLAYQDLIGHATHGELATAEKEMSEGERDSFHWANSRCLAMDTFMEVFKKTTGKRMAQQMYTEESEALRAWRKELENREEMDKAKIAAYEIDAREARRETTEAREGLEVRTRQMEDWKRQCTEWARRNAELVAELEVSRGVLKDFETVRRVLGGMVVAAMDGRNA